MATGDRYKLDLWQKDYLGQDIHNIFWFNQENGSGGSAELIAEFDETVLPLLKLIQSDGLAYFSILAENLDDVGDFAQDAPTTTAGTVTGEDMPPFVATEFRYTRASRSSRHGWKRFGGLTQIMMASEALEAAYVTAAGDLANVLGANLEDASQNLWVPKICRKQKVNDVWTYTFFGVQAVVYVRVTTQNSRKL